MFLFSVRQSEIPFMPLAKLYADGVPVRLELPVIRVTDCIGGPSPEPLARLLADRHQRTLRAIRLRAERQEQEWRSGGRPLPQLQRHEFNLTLDRCSLPE